MQFTLSFDERDGVEACAVIRADARLRSDPRVIDVRAALVTGTAVQATLAGLPLRVYQDYHGRWEAVTFGGGFNVYATREEAVADLDARVLALRAALMPADAEDRVVAVLEQVPSVSRSGDEDGGWSNAEFARRVLAALGIGGSS